MNAPYMVLHAILGYNVSYEGEAQATCFPPERHETVRQEIISALEGGPLTAKEISTLVKVPEREVYDRLIHIQRQLGRTPRELVVIPAECRKCGFQFNEEKQDHQTGSLSGVSRRIARRPLVRGQ